MGQLLDYRTLFAESEPAVLATVEAQLAQKLQDLDRQSPPVVVLLAEPEPISFLAGVLAAQMRGVAVILANPRWRRGEWQQVQEQVDYTLAWGAVPIPPRPGLEAAAYPPAGSLLIATGGTSGRIRFAVQTWERLSASAFGFQAHIQAQAIHCCCTLPLFHVSGLMQVVRSLVTGGRLVLSDYKRLEIGELPPLNPEQFWISLVPTQLQRLLSNPEMIPWLRRFAGILLGGAPPWPALLHQGRSQSLPLALTYGMTETASQVATLLPQEFLGGNSSSGRPLPHSQIRVIDPTGCPVKPGEIGQVTIQAKSLMWGYYGDFRENLSPLRELVSDDYGYLDEAGYLHILGRGSQMIISGGEKVFPPEVEAVLRDCPGIEDVCVLGVADEDWGQVVVAVYVPAGTESSEEIIMEGRSRLSQQLAPYKHPKRWLATERIPRNSRGKVESQAVHQLISTFGTGK
ncbi:MAG: 2-succinylbenzoate--CoA ligase [Phormidium sp. GEM2.Bin31]|nr:MAG: 2-succinylbenzoate--CoA ligase [Phormidium sp. GEM2.Bin31]